MGSLDNFLAEASSSLEVNEMVRSTDTANYITDLLGELHSIANISGLTGLSDDIQDVLSKHSCKAA